MSVHEFLLQFVNVTPTKLDLTTLMHTFLTVENNFYTLQILLHYTMLF